MSIQWRGEGLELLSQTNREGSHYFKSQPWPRQRLELYAPECIVLSLSPLKSTLAACLRLSGYRRRSRFQSAVFVNFDAG